MKSNTPNNKLLPTTSFLDSISSGSRQAMIDARKTILKNYDIKNGPDIVDDVDPTDSRYLPAFIRYSGRTFSQIKDAAWQQLAKHDDLDMVILSVFYGLLKYDEPIRNYLLESKTMITGIRIERYWRDHGAKEWLKDYIVNNRITKVIFVLSTSYASMIQRDQLIPELEADGILTENHQFKSAGRASMIKRGQYINQILLKS